MGICLSAGEYKQTIQNGVRKINYYSYAAKEGLEATTDLIRNDNPSLFHEVSQRVIKAMENNYSNFFEVIYNIKDND